MPATESPGELTSGPNGGTDVIDACGVCLGPGEGSDSQEKNINEDW